MSKDNGMKDLTPLVKRIIELDLKPVHMIYILAGLGMELFDNNEEYLMEFLEGEKEYDMKMDMEESEDD